LSNPQIAIVNESTVITGLQCQQLAAALQIQVSRDWLPAWGDDYAVKFWPGYKPSLAVEASSAAVPERPPANAWILAILDNSDQADALGYHDVTPTGQPLGKCFAKTTMDDGESWTVCASHELLEMLADPGINLIAQAGQGFWAYEVCDPCEDDQYAYAIALPPTVPPGDGILVSDFVFPSWFELFHEPGEKYDFRGHMSRSFQVLAGGYAQTFDPTTGNWTEINPAMAAKHAGSRLARRSKIGFEPSFSPTHGYTETRQMPILKSLFHEGR